MSRLTPDEKDARHERRVYIPSPQRIEKMKRLIREQNERAERLEGGDSDAELERLADSECGGEQ